MEARSCGIEARSCVLQVEVEGEESAEQQEAEHKETLLAARQEHTDGRAHGRGERGAPQSPAAQRQASHILDAGASANSSAL